MMTVEEVARICHEANRALCQAIGDLSVTWDNAPDWQRQSAIAGVEWRLAHPDAPVSAQHEAWLTDKLAQGWSYGEVKDADAKTHPCMLSYEHLPQEQRLKDALFIAIVETCRASLDTTMVGKGA